MEIVRSPSRRPGLSWKILCAAAVIAAAAAGYVLQSFRQGAEGAMAMPESGFDLNYVGASATAPHPRLPPAPKSSLVGVIAGSGFASGQAASVPAPAAQPAPAGALAAALKAFKGGVAATREWTTMLSSPAQFLINHTQLGSPATLRRFLADPRRVRSYAGHPLVQEVLSSPALVGLLLRPSVAHAFVSSPAMNDDAAVDALLKSPLVAQVLRSPGVQQALSDDADAVQGIVSDPQVTAWLGRHPAATAALGQVSPAFSALSLMGAAAPQHP